MDMEFARRQMVEQQVRTWDVANSEVLMTMATLAREQFVPPMYADLAYADTEILLNHNQCMLRPSLEGRILQSLDLQASDNVLEIGTGSGYLAACLGRLGGQVTSIDIFGDLLEFAEKNLRKAGVHNIDLARMDATTELPAGLFDVLVVTGSTPQLYAPFVNALKPGGRMFTVVGKSPLKHAVLVTRGGDDDWSESSLFETDIPELVNAPQIPPFTF